LHIAIVTNRFAPYVGGIERQMALVGRGLADRGHQVTVLTRRYDSTLPRRERLNGLTVERFGPSGQGVIAKWLVNLGTFRRLALRKPSFDCVLVTQFSATIMGPALARAIGRGAPLVLRPIEQGEFTGEVSRATLARLPRGAHGLARTALRMTRRMAYSQAKVLVVPSKPKGSAFRRIPSSTFPIRWIPARSARRLPLSGENSARRSGFPRMPRSSRTAGDWLRERDFSPWQEHGRTWCRCIRGHCSS
jgi:hypothetical protein